MKYYVYEWFNKENEDVFYVGKGTKNRYKVKNRNELFNKYILNNKVDVRIIKYFELESEAFEYESKLIAKYKKENQCSCNLEFGGNGGVSEIWTDEMREKMSIFNPMKDEKQKERMSKLNPMKDKEIAKKVGDKHKKIPIINGIEYKDCETASNCFGVHKFTIYRWCKRGYDTKGNPCTYKGEDNKGSIKITNSIKVIVDDREFNSVKEASEYIGVWSESLIRSIKNNKPCKGHKCEYANQQPS